MRIVNKSPAEFSPPIVAFMELTLQRYFALFSKSGPKFIVKQQYNLLNTLYFSPS